MCWLLVSIISQVGPISFPQAALWKAGMLNTSPLFSLPEGEASSHVSSPDHAEPCHNKPPSHSYLFSVVPRHSIDSDSISAANESRQKPVSPSLQSLHLPVSLKAGALDACSIFLSSSLGSHYKQGHLSWHLFVSSWRGNWCARVKSLLLPTLRCYSYFCAHLGNFKFLTWIWSVHKGILAHISLLNQHFS